MISKEVFDIVCYSCSAHGGHAKWGDNKCLREDNASDECKYENCPKWRKEFEKDSPLTPEEFMNKMIELYKTYIVEKDDEELAHGYMDDLICDLLINLGYEDGIKVFYATPKWYS